VITFPVSAFPRRFIKENLIISFVSLDKGSQSAASTGRSAYGENGRDTPQRGGRGNAEVRSVETDLSPRVFDDKTRTRGRVQPNTGFLKKIGQRKNWGLGRRKRRSR